MGVLIFPSQFPIMVDDVPRGSGSRICYPRVDSTNLHLHFEKLAYIDNACLDLVHNCRSYHQQAGNTVVMGWGKFRQRYDELSIESAALKKHALQGATEVDSPNG